MPTPVAGSAADRFDTHAINGGGMGSRLVQSRAPEILWTTRKGCCPQLPSLSEIGLLLPTLFANDCARTRQITASTQPTLCMNTNYLSVYCDLDFLHISFIIVHIYLSCSRAGPEPSCAHNQDTIRECASTRAEVPETCAWDRVV